MKKLRERIEEILKEFKSNLDANLAGDGKWLDTCFTLAADQILQAFKEMLPNPKQVRYEKTKICG